MEQDPMAVEYKYVCTEHNTEVMWSQYDLIDKGVPICPECGDDMELFVPTDLP